jgi:predicted lipoprotein with Yx(FWY)xxD motif
MTRTRCAATLIRYGKRRCRRATTVSTNPKSPTFHHGRRRTPALLTLAAVALVAAGCGDGTDQPAAGAVPSATGDLLSAQATSLGTILVGGNGRTLYEFANDTGGTSTCAGACAANWPFLPAPASLPASVPGVTGKLGATTRSDGARQLTVAGHPLYTFVGDSTAGQTNGQGVTLNGGLWTVASPAGAPVANPATAGAGPGPGY